MAKLVKGTKMNQDEFYTLLEGLDEESKKKFYESSKVFFSKQKGNPKLFRKRDFLKEKIKSDIRLLSELLCVYKEKHFEVLKKFESLGNLPLLTFEYSKDNIYFVVHTINGKFEFEKESNACNYFHNEYFGIYFGRNNNGMTVNLSHKSSELVNLQKSPAKLAQKYIYLWPGIVNFTKEIESAVTSIGDKLVAYAKLIYKIDKDDLSNIDNVISVDNLSKCESSASGVIEIYFIEDSSSSKKKKVKCEMALGPGPYSLYELFDFDDGYCWDDEYDLDE